MDPNQYRVATREEILAQPVHSPHQCTAAFIKENARLGIVFNNTVDPFVITYRKEYSHTEPPMTMVGTCIVRTQQNDKVGRPDWNLDSLVGMARIIGEKEPKLRAFTYAEAVSILFKYWLKPIWGNPLLEELNRVDKIIKDKPNEGSYTVVINGTEFSGEIGAQDGNTLSWYFVLVDPETLEERPCGVLE